MTAAEPDVAGVRAAVASLTRDQDCYILGWLAHSTDPVVLAELAEAITAAKRRYPAAGPGVEE